MSALGQKQTFKRLRLMSTLPPKADIGTQPRDVRYVPKADIGWAARCAGLATQRAESLMGEQPLPGGRKGTFLATRTTHCSRTGENQPGSITVLITWMTPLDCITLLMVISAVSPLARWKVQDRSRYSRRPTTRSPNCRTVQWRRCSSPRKNKH